MTSKVPLPVPFVNLPLMNPPSVIHSEGLLSCRRPGELWPLCSRVTGHATLMGAPEA